MVCLRKLRTSVLWISTTFSDKEMGKSKHSYFDDFDFEENDHDLRLERERAKRERRDRKRKEQERAAEE